MEKNWIECNITYYNVLYDYIHIYHIISYKATIYICICMYLYIINICIYHLNTYECVLFWQAEDSWEQFWKETPGPRLPLTSQRVPWFARSYGQHVSKRATCGHPIAPRSCFDVFCMCCCFVCFVFCWSILSDWAEALHADPSWRAGFIAPSFVKTG